ncbi:hypothetical protein LU293_04210 [Moraxella nasovis]|uniref:hypothetical protein n=1 Tax=Moraxella nasovis TaxID=2904121 RepID=UPI001F60B317|nr:hypothetical protein [Moraxella nasovis]UNU74106.1 hypothetical protein LU293_04210 [Moraxella nasovis]
MAFSLKDLKKPNQVVGEVVRTIKHKSGLQLELVVKQDTAFERALSKVQTLLNDTKIKKDDLKRANQTDITTNEALLMVIGEYNIKSWNVDVNGEPLEPSGDNLLIVLANISDGLPELLDTLFDTFTEMGHEYSEQVQSMKKKPSSTTTGKKQSQN